MSRLPFAPKAKEIEVTDIKRGLATFAPRPTESVSFAALKEALKRAGYTLASAQLVAVGTLRRDASGWTLVAERSAQTFILDTGALKQHQLADGTRVEVTGDWTTAGTGRDARETITAVSITEPTAAIRLRVRGKTVGAGLVPARGSDALSLESVASRRAGTSPAPTDVAHVEVLKQPPGGNLFTMTPVSFTHDESKQPPAHQPSLPSRAASSFSPIRTTSPGLTVYGGGAVTPRFTFTRQRLGSLEVNRQSLSVNVSYTPTPRLQLEAEASVARTAYEDGESAGAGGGFGNLSVSGKYRFYRAVGEWGDRQAAARFGLELPTGSTGAPDALRLPRVSAFVRQQLSPISGGLAAHGDLSYSQARGRLIFGGNVEGVLRAGRAGFRTGHELRANTDLEFVVFPFDYRKPTGEVFAILETNFVHRGAGRIEGREVAGSSATEFYLAPALQYVATPRVVFEGSAQLPVARRAGAEVLRTSASVLVGVRYLF